MVNHNWKLIKKTKYAKIFVDFKRRMTKIEGFKYTYFHKDIYPKHNPDYVRKYRKVNKNE